MASTVHVVCSAAVALAFWGAFGFVVMRRLVGSSMATFCAPAAGWAIHTVVALPLFFVLPWSAPAIVIVAVVAVPLVAFAMRRVRPEATPAVDVAMPKTALLLALVLAAIVASAILPKTVADGVALSDPIYDHAKVALVDEIARSGPPPGNPFLGGEGGAGRLAYYYLWHFGAGELSRALHVTGWEADAAMTFYSAFASLALMMALAVRIGGRPRAAWWVVAFAASASSRVLLVTAFGEGGLDAWIANPGGLGGWFYQAPWVPQHLAGTSCALLAAMAIARLAGRADVATTIVAGLLVAAGFETSTWIGGVVFAIAALVMVPVLYVEAEPSRRRGFVVAVAAVGVIAAIVASPFLHDQFVAATTRQHGAPIVVRPYSIAGEVFPAAWRALLDLPAYALVLLPIELTAIYLPGLFAIVRLLKRRDAAAPERRLTGALAALAAAALVVGGTLASTLADNNDLAWRAVLTASAALVVFAAAGFAAWIAERRRVAVALASIALLLGATETVRLARGDLVGTPRADDARFAAEPALWAAVRAHSSPDERVANDPYALNAMTPWPVNIGWSLLADRRSCYSTWELAQVYTSMPHDRLRAVDRRFDRVFAGKPEAGDLDALATTYDCAVAIVTSEDGAWRADPFATSDRWRLVDADAARWRIYRRRDDR